MSSPIDWKQGLDLQGHLNQQKSFECNIFP